MGDGDKKGSGSPAPLIIAAIVVAIGLVARQFDITSWRPTQSERTAHYSQPLQTVPARLWQDPLAAIADLRGRSPAPAGIEIWDNPSEIIGRFVEEHPGATDVDIILVPVFGGPYAEYGEGRRRQRYAIATGLLESDYAPADAEKLGVLRHAFPDSDEWFDIPFEWYSCKLREQRKCKKGRHVLLMWVNDDLLGSNPLARLDSLYPRFEGLPVVTKTIIGPAGSGGLIAMLEEVQSAGGGSFDDIRVISPSATIDPEALLNAGSYGDQGPWQSAYGVWQDAALPGRWGFVQSAFLSRGVRFVSTIGTDGRMALTLARETTLRQYSSQCLGMGDDSPPDCLAFHKVLVVSEGDTEYARSLAESYARHLVRTQCEVPEYEDERELKYAACKKKVDERVFRLTYLRGLDGETPRGAADGQDKDAKRGGPKADGRQSHSLDLLRAGETAVGNVQYDYLRRLGRSAKALERAASRQDMAVFHSIAIFGSDAYDKLLVMQVLRSEFPSAFFMTTDMDARYLQREQLDWSRNLVVATSYGLELNRSLREHSAPFRDAYQTSQFMAARLAVNEDCHPWAQQFIDARLARPRVFEISTAGPVELSLPGVRAGSADAPDVSQPWLRHAIQDGRAAKLASPRSAFEDSVAEPDKVTCRLLMRGGETIASVHPEPSVRQPWYLNSLSFALLTVLVLAAWYSLTVRRTIRKMGRQMRARWPEMLLGFAAVLFLCLPRTERLSFWVSAVVAACVCALLPAVVRYALRTRRLAKAPVAQAMAVVVRPFFQITGSALGVFAIFLFVQAWMSSGAPAPAAWLALPMAALGGALAHPMAWRRFVCMRYPGLIAGTALTVLLWALFQGALDGDAEEPPGFLNGASSWLSEALRVVALILNLWAIGRVFATLEQNEREINKKFFPERTLPPKGSRGIRSPLRHPHRWRAAVKQRIQQLRESTPGRVALRRVALQYVADRAARAWDGVVRTWSWLVVEWKGTDFIRDGRLNAADLWGIYTALCKPSRLLWRSTIGASLFLVLFVALVRTNPLVQPVRGVWTTLFDTALLLASVFTFFCLIFLVVDVVRLTAKFVFHQSIGETDWPSNVLPKVKISGVDRVLLDTTDLTLLSRRTAAVSGLVILPFIPLLLLVLARHEVVDNWAWTWPIVLLFGLCFLFLIAMSLELRRAAESGKSEVLRRLTLRRLQALGMKNANAAGYLDNVIQTMERVTTGAYSPFWQADWLRGLAIPTTGYGALELLRVFGVL